MDELIKEARAIECEILLLLGVKRIDYDEFDTDKLWPQYIPSGKPWRTHSGDSIGVPRFTEDYNAVASLEAELEKRGLDTIYCSELYTLLKIDGDDTDSKKWSLMRLAPPLRCALAAQSVLSMAKREEWPCMDKKVKGVK